MSSSILEEKDPAGVKALLDLLRTQQEPGTQPKSPIPAAPATAKGPDNKASEPPVSTGTPSSATLPNPSLFPTIAKSRVLGKAKEDLRYLPLPQVLSYLEKLVEDESFMDAFVKLKAEQDAMENRLLAARAKLHQSAAAAKSASDKDKEESDGSGVKEEDSPSDTAAKDAGTQKPFISKAQLEQFDLNLLKRWDDLVTKQQEALEKLGLPCFFKTSRKSDIMKQQKVMKMLMELLEK